MARLRIVDDYDTTLTPGLLDDKEFPIHCELYGNKDYYLMIKSDHFQNKDIMHYLTDSKPLSLDISETYDKFKNFGNITLEDGIMKISYNDMRISYKFVDMTIRLNGVHPMEVLNEFILMINKLDRIRYHGFER